MHDGSLDAASTKKDGQVKPNVRPGSAVGIVPVPARYGAASVFVVVQPIAVVSSPVSDVVDLKVETNYLVPVDFFSTCSQKGAVWAADQGCVREICQ